MKISDLLSVPSIFLHGKDYEYGEVIARFAPFSVHLWAIVLRDGRRKMIRNEVMIGEFVVPLYIPLWREGIGKVLDRLGCVDLESITLHGESVTAEDIHRHVQKWLSDEQIMLELYREQWNDPPHLEALWRGEAARAAIRYRIVSEGLQVFQAAFPIELTSLDSSKTATEKNARRRTLLRHLKVQRAIFRIFTRKPRGATSSRSSTDVSHKPGIIDRPELIERYGEAIRRHLDNENAYLDCQTLDDPEWLDRYAIDDELTSREWTIADYTEEIRLNPNEAQAYYCRGVVYFSTEQVERAITDFDNVIRLNPDDGRAYYCRALCYFSMESIEQAITDINTAISLAPYDALALYCRADYYLNLGKVTEAVADINTAISLAPRSALACYCRGLWYGYLAQYEKAIAQFDAVLKLMPDDTRAYFYRGMCHSRIRQYEQANNDFDEMIHRAPNDAVAFRNRGVARVNLGRSEDALADYTEAIRLMPDDSEAFRGRGVAYRNLQQYDHAFADFDEAIRLNLRYVDAYHDRAYAHIKVGQFERGLRDLDEVIRLAPNDSSAYRHRAIAYRILKQRDRARADFKMAKILAQ